MKNNTFTTGTELFCSPPYRPEGAVSCDAGTSASFSCSADFGPEKVEWKACVSIVFHTPYMCEAVAEGRSTSFHFIVGYQMNGCFLCVPSHDFGCELAALSDTFWNRERISAYLCPIDTITLANAIASLDDLWGRVYPAERRHYA